MSNERIEPEIVEEQESTELDIRRPDVPITVEEIAALGPEEAKKVIAAREQIIETLRAASIRQTHPSDWVLYKDTRTGRVLAFLEDKGCQRLMDLWGVEITRITSPTRDNSEDGASYAYTIVGDGFSKVTRRSVLSMEGVRYSTERFATEKPDGIEREVAVKKAARANLEGRIVRNLAGLNGVPLEELVLVSGDKYFETKASKGRGYGTQAQRQGVENEAGDQGDAPICDACVGMTPRRSTKMRFRSVANEPDKKKKERGDYWYCPEWKTHENVRSFVGHADWLKQVEASKKATAEQQREPGEE